MAWSSCSGEKTAGAGWTQEDQGTPTRTVMHSTNRPGVVPIRPGTSSLLDILVTFSFWSSVTVFTPRTSWRSHPAQAAPSSRSARTCVVHGVSPMRCPRDPARPVSYRQWSRHPVGSPTSVCSRSIAWSRSPTDRNAPMVAARYAAQLPRDPAAVASRAATVASSSRPA
jgi:hypothetical protein